MKKAYFAGGCFWCITPVFRDMEGVFSVTAGYCGGDEENPAYQDVKTQKTHHRETICVVYDPEQASYRDLVTVFLECVDPFDGGGQFIDRGMSYTPALYYTDEAERILAGEMLSALAEKEGKTPAVSVEPYKQFWPAEDYHQDYDLKNPEAFALEVAGSGRGSVSCPLRFRKKKRTGG